VARGDDQRGERAPTSSHGLKLSLAEDLHISLYEMSQWPAIPFDDWCETRETLHRYAQIVGKIQLGLTPRVNHFWNVTLRVTAHGLATTALLYKDMTFDLELDLLHHELVIRTSAGPSRTVPLGDHSVADFYREVFASLDALGIHIHVWDHPVELKSEAIPFHEDRTHAIYDREFAERFFHVLTSASRVLEEFRARFIGKCSGVGFYWGTFDLSVARYNGRRVPHAPTEPVVERESYSHELSEAGFWPGDITHRSPAFFAFHYPQPPGFERAIVRPDGAAWDEAAHCFVLPYDGGVAAEEILTFCQSTYETGANLATWDREQLERS
jgi:hypothetical protein